MNHNKFAIFLVLLGLSFLKQVLAAQPSNAAIEKNIITAVNEYRVQHRLQPLKTNSIIALEANGHSLNMANKRIAFGHQNFNQRIKHIYAKVAYCRSGAENVAYFPPSKSAKDVVSLWLTSPGHRRNIEGKYNLTGVGIARDKRGWIYYTQTFVQADALT